MKRRADGLCTFVKLVRFLEIDQGYLKSAAQLNAHACLNAENFTEMQGTAARDLVGVVHTQILEGWPNLRPMDSSAPSFVGKSIALNRS